MRRLLRWTVNGAAAVSAVLFLATCVLWARSDSVIDTFSASRGRHMFFVSSERGTIAFGWDTNFPPNSSVWVAEPAAESLGPWHPDCSWRRAGVEWWCMTMNMLGMETRPVPTTFRVLTVRNLWIALPAAALPALAAFRSISRRRRQRTKNPDLCPYCGYDLRATPDV